MGDAGHFRTFARSTARTPASLRLDGEQAVVELTDLGMGGAGVACELELVEGETVELVLQAPNRWEPLVLPGRVAWARPPRAGIAFELNEEPLVWALFELLGTEVFEG